MDAPSQTHPPANLAAWRTLFPLCLTVFAVIVHASGLAPLATDMARDLGTSVPRVAQISTALLAAMGLFGLLVGPLADHFGHRRALLLGLATLAISAVAMALAPSYRALLASGLLAGCGATILGVTFAVAAARYVGDTRRALGRVQAAQTAGSILGAPLLTAVAAASGWRGAYVIVVATYLLAFVLVARTLPRDPHPDGTLTWRAILAAYRPLARDRRMCALYAASALRALGWLGPFLFFGAFLADRHGLSLRQIGLAYMVASGGMFAGNLAAGQWGGDARRTFATAAGILALALVGVYALPLPTLPTVAAMTIAACAGGISWINLTTLLATETPAGPGTTMTLNGAVFALGSALGSAIGGLVVAVGGYTLLGFVLPSFTLTAALLIWRPRVAWLRTASRRRWAVGGER